MLICCVSAVANAQSCALRKPSSTPSEPVADDDDDGEDDCSWLEVEFAAAIDNSAGSRGRYGFNQFNESDEIVGS